MPVPFDQHTIDTPEQMQLHFAVAGIGSRFLALCIDSLIQFGLFIVGCLVLLGLAIALRIAGGSSGALWMVAIGLGFFFLLNFGYFALFEIFWHGQTPGKRYVGIRVVKDSGRPLTAPETIGRNLMRIIDQLPAMYAVGIVCALTNSRSQRLGDLVVGSLVIRETKEAGLMPQWDKTDAVPIAGSSGISLDDLRLIESFLSRRSELPDALRQSMAAQVFMKVKPEEMLLPDGMSHEAALEELVRTKRG